MTTLTEAALARAAAGFPRVYDRGSVPDNPTYPYVVLSASLGRGDAYTLDSTYGVRHGRVVGQAFSPLAAAARAAAEDVIDQLLDHALAFDPGFLGTPMRIELDPTDTESEADRGIEGVTFTLDFTAAKTAPASDQLRLRRLESGDSAAPPPSPSMHPLVQQETA